jgi:carboxymethylenebutenolidase
MKTWFTLVAIMMTVAAADEVALPPDAPDALAALNASPRHGEWIDIERPGLKAPLRTWIVYPERGDKAPVVVLIHGIYGFRIGLAPQPILSRPRASSLSHRT